MLIIYFTGLACMVSTIVEDAFREEERIAARRIRNLKSAAERRSVPSPRRLSSL